MTTADAPGSRPLAGTTALPSDWMGLREQRQRNLYLGWLAGLAVSTVIGLVDQPWLWLPAAVAASRGWTAGTVWLRVGSARRRTRRTGVVAVPASARRAAVQPDVAETPTILDPCLVRGSLHARDGGWSWQPARTIWSESQCLDLPAATVLRVTTGRGTDPGMPAADYVQVTTRAGLLVDFLVWDYDRLPALRRYG